MRQFSRTAIRIGWAVVMMCVLLGGTAFARDKGRDFDHRGGWTGHRDHDRDWRRDRREHDRDWRQDRRERREREWARHRQDEDWRRHEHFRDHDKNWQARNDRRPPGWDRGRKEGWRDGDVPPGLAKK